MDYTVISEKTESHTFGVWPVKEKVTTTMSLVNMGNGQLGLSYESTFSGIKEGDVKGGPEEIDGDVEKVVNDSPKVVVAVSEFNKASNYASMHVEISVEIPVIGTEQIYSQTLGGSYSEDTGWSVAIARASSAIEIDKRKSVS